MVAAHHGHVECIETLAQHGADINQTQIDGWTALMVAACNKHSLCVERLINLGGNVTLTSKDGHNASAFSVATSKKCRKILKRQLKNIKYEHSKFTFFIVIRGFTCLKSLNI